MRPEFVSAIRDGVDLMFIKPVKPSYRDNYTSVYDHLDAVVAEIDRLVQLGKLEKVAHRPYIVSPMGAIVKPDTKKVRIVLDTTASGLNDCLHSPPMKLPTLSTILARATPNCYQAKHDLADAFLSIPVRPEHCDVLGIRHPVTGDFYRYRFLCFGLTCAPFIFQSFMEATREVLTARGVSPCIPYVDDWWLCAKDELSCKQQNAMFEEVIDLIGFRRALHKRVGPAQRIDWCGLDVCTSTRTVGLTSKKWAKARSLLDEALTHVEASGTLSVTLKFGHSLSGYLTHVAFVVLGGTTCLRNLWTEIGATQVQLSWAKVAKRQANDTVVVLSSNVVADLRWWRNALDKEPRRPLYVLDGKLVLWSSAVVPNPLAPPAFCRVITMDASSVGWGFWYGNGRWSGLWTEAQSHCSSNWRELKTMSIALHKVHKIDSLANCAVLGVSDNTATVAYTNKGQGRSESLMSLVREIRNFQIRIGAEVVAVHLPGKRNELADTLSRAGTTLYYERAVKNTVVSAIETRLHKRVTHVAVTTLEHIGSRTVIAGESAYQFDQWPRRDAGAVLWCPSPHQVVQTIKFVVARPLTELHVLLLPEVPDATWWPLLSRSKRVMKWDANSQLFSNAPSLTLPGVTGGFLRLPMRVSVPWVAVVFHL